MKNLTKIPLKFLCLVCHNPTETHGHPPGEYVPISCDEKIKLQLGKNQTSKKNKLPGKEISKQDLQEIKSSENIQEVQTILDENGDEIKIFWIQEKFLGVNRMCCEIPRLPKVFTDSKNFTAETSPNFNSQTGFHCQIVKGLLENSENKYLDKPSISKLNEILLSKTQSSCDSSINLEEGDTCETMSSNEDENSQKQVENHHIHHTKLQNQITSYPTTPTPTQEIFSIHSESRQNSDSLFQPVESEKDEMDVNLTPSKSLELGDWFNNLTKNEGDRSNFLKESVNLESIINDLKKVENLVIKKEEQS